MGTSDATVKIRVDPDELGRWQASARRSGLTLSAFIRETVGEAIDEDEIDDAVAAAGGKVRRVPPGTVSVTVRTTTDPARPVQPTTADVVRCPKASLHKKATRCGYCGQTP